MIVSPPSATSASALATNGCRSAERSVRSAAFHVATTLYPPPCALSTLFTRSGAMSFGRGEKPAAVTCRSRSAVYGASSVEGSSVWTCHVAVEASTVLCLPAFARLTAASTPLS